MKSVKRLNAADTAKTAKSCALYHFINGGTVLHFQSLEVRSCPPQTKRLIHIYKSNFKRVM